MQAQNVNLTIAESSFEFSLSLEEFAAIHAPDAYSLTKIAKLYTRIRNGLMCSVTLLAFFAILASLYSSQFHVFYVSLSILCIGISKRVDLRPRSAMSILITNLPLVRTDYLNYFYEKRTHKQIHSHTHSHT